MAFLEVIKYEGDNSTFVWKHPVEDFNCKSQLIVHESQQAIFFADGKIGDVFDAGRYTLNTGNIPILRHLINLPLSGDSPFHCEVYFVNKTVQMSIKWGTDSKVRFVEPTMGLPLEIGACGEMNVRVSDAKKLLLNLVGTTHGIAWGGEDAEFAKSLQNCFRPMISTAVKTHLAAAIKSKNIDIVEIDEHLEELSEVLRGSILSGFEEYGLTVPQLYITNVILPEEDVNFRRLRDLHTVSFQTRMIQAEALVKSAKADADADVIAANRKAELERQVTETEIARREAERDLIRAQANAQATKMAGVAEAEVMAAKGYTQKDVIQADVQKSYAEGIGNMTITGGGGGVVSDVIGLGVGMAAATAVAPQIGEMFKAPAASEAPSVAEEKCAKCGAALPANAKFCLECGEKVAPTLPEEMIACPECGKAVSKSKFCSECGHKLVATCPKCGVEVAAGAKFCPDCGEKL